MKRPFRLIGYAAAALLLAATPAVHAQEDGPSTQDTLAYISLPAHDAPSGTGTHFTSAAVAAPSLPTWSYSLVSSIDGNTYNGSMAGGDPFFNGARTTNIPTYVVPLILVMPDGGVFDPTAMDSCSLSPTVSPVNQVLQSPVFTATNWTMNGTSMGYTQYPDAFQRANFWNSNVSTTGQSYHTMLSPVTVLAPITLQIPSGLGSTNRGCPRLGVVDLHTLDNLILTTAMPLVQAQGVTSASLPLFLMHDVTMANPGNSIRSNCCTFGYNSVVASQNQTYAVAEYETTGIFSYIHDISPVSATVANWLDNPLALNQAPAWGHVLAVQGCETALNVGDPLAYTTYNQPGVRTGVPMPNGITYSPVELAFFSWFYRQAPSIGAGGKDSDNGSFANPLVVCQ